MHQAHHATFAFLDTLHFRRVNPHSQLCCTECIATKQSCRRLHGHQILTLFVSNPWVSIRHPSHTHTPVNAVVGSETESVWGTGVRLESGLESGIFAHTGDMCCELLRQSQRYPGPNSTQAPHTYSVTQPLPSHVYL